MAGKNILAILSSFADLQIFGKRKVQLFLTDTWTNISIGDSKLNQMGYCGRCIIVTIDPETGIKSQDMQPLKTLRAYRMNKEIHPFKPLFGVYLDWVEDDRKVSIGDQITQRDDKENFSIFYNIYQLNSRTKYARFKKNLIKNNFL